MAHFDKPTGHFPPGHFPTGQCASQLLGGLLLVLLCAGLGACGHKGDLQLPEPQPTDEPASSQGKR